ncbi:MAG: 3-hydroxy-3-methylglutaryl-coenzyme A (HMG-CoA) reductase isozyme [Watsoniomyces obsoletus]|nr:MAG: 3-hydroxy-3-methylglutaryl-coenzyme A (HMG-CoA) reductase isozyme [Watsoniomyces obsoletus]
MQSFNVLVFSLLALLAVFDSTVLGHSWVEQLMVIGEDGFFTGAPGYPRANVLRTTPGFGDPAMVNLIPGKGNSIQANEPMCKSSQSKPNQSEGSPALKAMPGSLIALRYQENGHVTLPDNQLGKAQNRGTVFIYGTTDPQPTDTFLNIHNVWNAEGNGGDKRGKLLAAQNYDDGQCYQINGGSISKKRQSEFPHEPSPLMGQDLWCQNNIKLPEEAVAGKPYTLYWVWDWSTAPNVDPGLPKGKAEIYTTCMDVEVTAQVSQQSKIGRPAVKNVQQKKDLGNAAIPSLIAPFLGSSTPSSVPSATAPARSAAPSTAQTVAPSASPSPAQFAESPPASPRSSRPTPGPQPAPSQAAPVASPRLPPPAASVSNPLPTTVVQPQPVPSPAAPVVSPRLPPPAASVANPQPTPVAQPPPAPAPARSQGTVPAAPKNTCACDLGFSQDGLVKRDAPPAIQVVTMTATATVTVTATATATIYPSGPCLPSTATTLVKRAAVPTAAA